MTLSELARSAGLSEVTITHYQAVGLIRPAVHGHRPLYDQRNKLRLEVIAKARTLGFSLGETKALIEAHGTRETDDLSSRQHDLQDRGSST